MPDESYIERVVTAFLENEDMNATEGYLARGRRFASLTVDHLREEWAEAYRQTFAVGGSSDAETFDDLRAELRLRRLEEPMELVEAESAAMRERIAADYARAKAEGRDLVDDDSPIITFMRSLHAPPRDSN